MTDTTFPPMTPRDEDEALAGEYVLGVLDLVERLQVEARIKSDAAFAALVTAWESRMAPLNAEYPEVTPAAQLFRRIETRLFPGDGIRHGERRGFSWRLWGGLAGTAAAAVLAVALVLPQLDSDPRVLAVLTTEDQSLSYQANWEDGQLMVTRVAGTAAPEGQVHELWIIAPDAAPVSLGLLADAETARDYPEPPAGWTLAVSLEPAGGSPTGAPTGPVLMAGEIGV